MRKHPICAALCALTVAAFCAPVCTAQQLTRTVPACGLRRLDPAELAALGEIRAAALTWMPPETVAFLDNKPLALFKPITPEELSRVLLFSTQTHPSIGVTPLLAIEPPAKTSLKIRCINPQF